MHYPNARYDDVGMLSCSVCWPCVSMECSILHQAAQVILWHLESLFRCMLPQQRRPQTVYAGWQLECFASTICMYVLTNDGVLRLSQALSGRKLSYDYHKVTIAWNIAACDYCVLGGFFGWLESKQAWCELSCGRVGGGCSCSTHSPAWWMSGWGVFVQYNSLV